MSQRIAYDEGMMAFIKDNKAWDDIKPEVELIARAIIMVALAIGALTEELSQ